MPGTENLKIYFSDYFEVDEETLDQAGLFNVSLINDLPLFIDPFLLFNSPKPEYKQLHDNIIKYLRFLRDRSCQGAVSDGLLKAWFTFSEVRQNWLGFSQVGNGGSGLGRDFAVALNANLYKVFTNFGSERVTRGSHLEKLCLISDGVGRDNISDFTTNLIKDYLLELTQQFARDYVPKRLRKTVMVEKARFNYQTETWQRGIYELPYIAGDYVILTPADMLTKDEVWINKEDLIRDYPRIALAVPDEQLRAQLDNYLMQELPKDASAKKKNEVIAQAYRLFPELLEYYIRFKEDHGDEAEALSEARVAESRQLYIDQVVRFVDTLALSTGFYQTPGDTFDEARARVLYMKDVIENRDGYRIFYVDGQAVRRETDLHILFKLTWFATPSDINAEVNNGRGPVDFKASRGAFDKTLIEFKLASNSQLAKNLQHQVPIYERANDTKKSLKVIVYFSEQERLRVQAILRELVLDDDPDIILINARSDDKPSASTATSS